MIPKKIHYCWFGGNPLPELVQNCIASWKKYCPDYEIIEWNESNFDVNFCAYTKEAYEAKKWAFVSDVARLYALVHCGGIYMDTDVEVLKPLDQFLQYQAVSGFESEERVLTCMMACEKDNVMFREFLDEYQNAHFLKSDGSFDLTTNVVRITKTCLKYGLVPNNTLQTVNTFTLFPVDFFSPKNYLTGELVLTENSYMIHHFDGSWKSPTDKLYHEIQQKHPKLCSVRLGSYAAMFISTVKCEGFASAVKAVSRISKRGTK